MILWAYGREIYPQSGKSRPRRIKSLRKSGWLRSIHLGLIYVSNTLFAFHLNSTFLYLLRNLAVIALFAINYLWTVGSIRSFKFVGATVGMVVIRFIAHALAMPELYRVFLFSTFNATTTGTQTRERYRKLPVETKLCINYPESIFAGITPYNFF